MKTPKNDENLIQIERAKRAAQGKNDRDNSQSHEVVQQSKMEVYRYSFTDRAANPSYVLGYN